MKPSINLIVVSTILSSVVASAQEATGGGRPNLLINPSFEDGEKGWDFGSYAKHGTVSVDTNEKHHGKSSIRIENSAGDDSFLKQVIAVKPKTRYRMSGYIKTKDLVTKGAGATLSLGGEGTVPIAVNKNWTKVTFEFDTGPSDSIMIGPRLGHNSAPVMGVAWFDELSLVELGPSRKR